MELGSDLDHIGPFIRCLALTRFRVDYFPDGHNQNDAFMIKLGQHISQIRQVDRSQINWDAISLLKETTYRPDLHNMGFAFDSTEFTNDDENFVRAIVSMCDGTTWTGLSQPPAGVRMPHLAGCGKTFFSLFKSVTFGV